MGMEAAKSRALAASARRIAAMVVTIGCHLALLMALLRPVAPRTEKPSGVESDEATLKVRVIAQSQRTPALPVSRAPSKLTAPTIVPRKTPAMESLSASAKHVAPVVAPPSSDTHVINVSPTPGGPDPDTGGQTSAGDGAFRERMFDARHAQGIRGVPGSDKRVVQGIELSDPMDLGIGVVVRSAQRLLGVASHHYIDVDVWQQLSPEELIARHLTMDDVKKESEKYGCNRPMGLNF